MATLPKNFIPAHDCYQYDFKFDYDLDKWCCSVCGQVYVPPLSRCAIIKPPQILYFKPWETPLKKMHFQRGQVFWRPERDYSKNGNS